MKKIIALAVLTLFIFTGCSLFKKAPEERVNQAVSNYAEVTEMSSSLLLSGVVNAPADTVPAKVNFSLEMEGSADTSEEESPKVDMKMKISASADSQGGAGEVQFRLLDKKVYFNVLGLESAITEPYEAQFAPLLNKWWQVPGEGESPFGALTGEQEALKEKLKSLTFFTNAVEEGEEEIRGMKMTRYRVDLNRDALQEFILEAARMGGNTISPEQEGAVAESLKSVEFSGAVWVSSDDILHRIRGTLAVQPVDGPSSSFEIDYTGWNYGDDVSVAAPEGAQEFNPFLLAPIFSALGGMSGGASLPTDTAPGQPIDSPLGSKQVE